MQEVTPLGVMGPPSNPPLSAEISRAFRGAHNSSHMKPRHARLFRRLYA